MIDRRKGAHQEQTGRHLVWAVRNACQHGSHPEPQEHQGHHAVSAPAVAQPARRQSKHRKSDETRGGRQQQLAILTLAAPLQHHRHRGVNQHEIVGVGVPQVEEQ